MHKLLKTSIAAIVISGALAGGVLAQEASESHLSAARAAIQAINATDPYDAILPAVSEGLAARLIQNNPDLEAQISQFVQEETLAIAARRADLENEAAKAYARAFTEADLRAIADFYATDAGRALLLNAPVVAREVDIAAAVWRRGIERDLVDAVSRRLDQAGVRANAPAEEVPAEGAPATTGQ